MMSVPYLYKLSANAANSVEQDVFQSRLGEKYNHNSASHLIVSDGSSHMRQMLETLSCQGFHAQERNQRGKAG
ncbi:hypothetical protein CBW56_02310 [Denitratisoma oestradiolicum]|nr:hypothetical protein CBW56_02310 [Denitratisoma oestradiolicum]